MTYQEIISLVSQRLGHATFQGELKTNYRYAVKFALNELMNVCKPTKTTIEIPIVAESMCYDLPDDFGTPEQIVILDTNNNQLRFNDVSYEQWLRWNPLYQPGFYNDTLPYQSIPQTVPETAQLQNTITISFNLEPTGYKLYVKPTINARIQLFYTVSTPLNIFENTSATPPIPEKFHQYIIEGAIQYLAEIEAGQRLAKNDFQGASYFRKLGEDSMQKFKVAFAKVDEHVDQRSGATVAKGFAWFENLRRYR